MERHISKSRTFEQIAKEIALYITAQGLKVEEKLPTERELSEVLTVSRSSVREGLRVLEILGFVKSKQGNGTYVSNTSFFLIPLSELGSEVPREQLDQYWETGLAIGEKLLHQAIKRHGQITDIGAFEDSWDELCRLIVCCGMKAYNPVMLSLWQEIYELLKAHGYFSAAGIVLAPLTIALAEGSHERVTNYFDKFN